MKRIANPFLVCWGNLSFNPPLCMAVALVLGIGLLWGGTLPIAVGLFPSPWDKLAHFVIFAVISYFVWLGLRGRHWFITGAIVSTVAALDEIHQIWLPGRQADVFDFMADFSGICLVLLLCGNPGAAKW